MFNWSQIIAVTLFLTPALALADSPTLPYSHTTPSADGKYLFVMIPPATVEEEIANWNAETGAKIQQIRNKYSESGLYLNDGSSTAIWTVTWYAHSVVPLNDGIHLVRSGPWTRLSTDEAVSFFAKGKLSATYQVCDLVTAPMLMPHSVSHFAWRAATNLDNAKKTYTIETKHGERYIFDATTGELISSSSPFPLLWLVLSVGVAAIGFVVWRRKKHRQQRRLTNDLGG